MYPVQCLLCIDEMHWDHLCLRRRRGRSRKGQKAKCATLFYQNGFRVSVTAGVSIRGCDLHTVMVNNETNDTEHMITYVRDHLVRPGLVSLLLCSLFYLLLRHPSCIRSLFSETSPTTSPTRSW
jgi:hypothetical protein